MLKFIRIDRHRFNVLLCCALSVFTFVFISACSESQDVSTDGNANTGSIPFSVVLHDASSTRALTTPIDCDDSGIATLEAKVYSQTDQLLKVSASWSCSDHGGVIENVPPDTYTVCFLGKDSAGNILYRGKSIAIPVRAGEAADTVDIVCYDFKPDLTAPANDTTSLYPLESLVFQWQPITGALEYQIQISTDSTFETTEITATIDGDSTSYTPTDSIPLGMIYWRVNATDEYGYTGEWSATGNFTLATIAQWSEISKLLADDGAEKDLFGRSVSISGNYAIIGAPQEDEKGIDSGSAYIFKNEGGTWTQKQKIYADDVYQDWAEFGWSVSIYGDYAIIGAHMDDHDATKSHEGAAYIFKRSGETWTQIKKLIATAPDPPLPDGGGGPIGNGRFGCSVYINGEYAIVGAWGADPNGDTNKEGAAYIFSRNLDGTDNWGFQNMINAEDYTEGAQFGYSVSISDDADDDFALVGAPGDNGETGSVYIFQRTDAWDWGNYHTLAINPPPYPANYHEHTEHYKITASDGAALDQFGYSVSISPNYGMVGAPYHDGTGSVYVLEWDGEDWLEHEDSPIVPSDVVAGDDFGISVSSDDDRAIVGSWKTNNTGAAYILNKSVSTWSAGQKILAGDGTGGELFGVSVSISGDNAIVGAYNDDDTDTDAGSAYIFDYY